MTKIEFINGLQRALVGKMESSDVIRHVTYYQEYIEIEVRKGTPEEQVVEELGTPALLAKSILSAAYDGEKHLDEITIYSLGTRLKSVCMQLAATAGNRIKIWFEQL